MRFVATLVVLFALTPSFTWAEMCIENVPVCGFRELCVENVCEFYQTYDNTCDMEADGAELMHSGACESGGGYALSRFLSDTRPLFPRGFWSYDFTAFITAIASRLFSWI
ncbi:MAG TPA: hypothetical protein VJH33_01240 [Candidatus Paceibacterota bacterium]